MNTRPNIDRFIDNIFIVTVMNKKTNRKRIGPAAQDAHIGSTPTTKPTLIFLKTNQSSIS